MKNCLFAKELVAGLLVLSIFMSIIPSTTIALEKLALEDDRTESIGEEKEYWALLVAAGVYADNPEQNSPFMLEGVDDLYDVFLESPCWSEDHIKVVKGEDATVLNIIRGLRWLDRMEDEDDISLVYITTHGSPLGFDIWPRDEDDGTDELLMSYWGFAYPFSFIWDDELNFLLNRLNSQGVCLIVDSCFAGGFNDSFGVRKRMFPGVQMSPVEWMEGFAEDVRGKGRVVIMSSREDEVSVSEGLTPFLIDGLRGFADRNLDGVVTAEEVFFYAEPRCFWQHPTLYDGYPGELPLLNLSSDIHLVARGTNRYDLDRLEAGWRHVGSENHSGDAIVCGYVTDAETDDPIEDTFVEIEWHDDPLNMDWYNTISNSYGFYTSNVAEGYVTLRFFAEGYFFEGTEWFKVNENDILWVNASLDAIPPENAVVCGYVTDVETSEPLKDVHIALDWLDDQGHMYWYDSEGNALGFYSINTSPGEVYLYFFAEGYALEKTYRNDAVENETIWVNISLRRYINVDITKPLKAIYIKNRRILPFPRTVILGDIDIEVIVYGYWYEPVEVDKVEFYIDDDLKNTVTSPPYTWTWDEKSLLKRKHTITVKAYDKDETITTKEIQVWKFL